MTLQTRLASAVMIALTLTGCGDTPGGGTTASASPEFRLEPIVRIGSLGDAAPEYLFSFVLDLDVDPTSGEIYVSDRDAREIRVFSRAGDFLRRIGGPGDGPGEFDIAPRLGVARDTLVALGQNGLHVFLTSGRHVRTNRYTTRNPKRVPTSVERGGGGWRITTLEYGRTPTDPPHDRLYGVDLPELELSDPLAEIEAPREQSIYLEHPSLGITADGYIVADPLDYRLVRYRAGRPADTLALDVEPIVPLPSDGDVWADQQRKECAEFGDGSWCDEKLSGFLEQTLAIDLPDRRPVVGAILASSGGDLLIERTDLDPEPFDLRSEKRWDLIRGGEIVGRVVTPGRVRVHWFGASEIWGVQTDEFDVEYIVGYRILRP